MNRKSEEGTAVTVWRVSEAKGSLRNAEFLCEESFLSELEQKKIRWAANVNVPRMTNLE